MSDASSNQLFSPEELAAAKAEVEALPTGEQAAIPSLEPDGPPGPVLVPVPTGDAKLRTADSGAPAIRVPLVGGVDAAASATAPAPPATEAPKQPTRRFGLGTLLYRFTDAMLELINRPFRWLSAEARLVVGLCAALTLVSATAVIALQPLFAPRRDPFAFLFTPPPAPPAAEHGASGSAAAGHGAAAAKPAAPSGHH